MTATRRRSGPHPQPRPFALAELTARLPGTYAERAGRLRIRTRRWARLVARGALTIDEAEQFAFAIGLHPCELWGDLWWYHAERGTP